MRCFVAMDISDSLKPEIARIQGMIAGEGVSMVSPENLHITLKFLGEIGNVGKIDRSLKSINYPIFTIELRTFGAFPNIDRPNVLWLGIEGKELGSLANMIDDRLYDQGIARNDKPFSAHLTIARIKKSVKLDTDRLKDVYIGKQVVDSFCLKQSMITPKGPVYTNINQYKLC